ncbi:drug/metabolite transporter (DMT)-like permease [Microbacterium testaceum]|uniref:DMT family transporter n=1 Tax=Microbacterium TaxID=33882 RepID=UPI001AE4554E|nr:MULTISPECIES: DMT family transporter [Microbacterium]MDQ1113557.1 drug/metabolite transporter (DMT)-like permease [Microbacterium testaceum]MDQ1177696.1 drug/metabolite transporter (DMT)-like permease [Microbacterium sp. SORGH_AS_0421]MDR6099343.1 drug/metabolite transporter (DMT)-like permease [Microbacterium sp. SORGH_AS_0454]
MTTSSVTLPRPTHRGSTAVTGLAIAVASALAFSSSGPFVKPLLDGGWSLGAVLLVRMGLAALLLSPALVRAVRRQPGFLRRHGLLIVSFGLTAVAGCQLFYFAAMQRMPVAVALLIQYIAPVLIVIAVWVRTRRSPSRAVLIGSVVAMAGLVLVVDISGARFDLLGTLFALCAAVCAAAYFVIAGRAGDDLPPLALAAGGLLTGALLMGVLVLTGVLPFAAPSITVSLAGLELPGILPLLWVGGVATTVGYALGVIAVPLIGARLASFVGLSEVLFALGFAWLLLGETPAPVQFAGGALILVGVVLVRMDAGSPTEQKTETASIPVIPAP